MRTLREIAAAPFIHDGQSPAISGRGWGYVFAIVGTILFSMKAILVKLIYQPTGDLAVNELDAITVLALRLGFSAPVYIAILWWLSRRPKLPDRQPAKRTDYLLAAILGMLGYYICAWLDIEGLKYITSQLERLLLFTYPVFVFIFGALFFGKPMGRHAVVSIFIAYAGVGVIFAGGDIAIGTNVPLGSAMILTCAAAFAVFQLLAKPMISRLGSPRFTCLAMLGAGTMIFVHFIVENLATGQLPAPLALPARVWWLGLALAVFSTLMPSFLVNIAIGRIGPQAVATMGMISPIATIILAIWWLGEPFGALDAVGTGLTIFGIGLYTWFDRQLKSKPATQPLATGK